MSAPQRIPEFLPFLSRMKSFVRDLDGTIRLWNQGASDVYGWTSQEAIGEHCHRLFQTFFPKALSEIEAELLNAGSWQGELQQRRRDGRKLVVLSNWALHYDGNGEPATVTETNYNLADLSQAQIDLKSTREESYHRLLELEVLYRTAPVGLAFFDQDLRYLRLNKAFATINALPVEAHIGRHASELNPRLANIFVPMMAQVLASRLPLLNIEMTGSTPGDFIRPRTWMVNFYPVTNARTFGVSVAFQDITALKATEDIRTRLGVIVESSDDAMISMTLDSTITTWNSAAERMFGYSAEEAIGETIATLATPHRPKELLGILERLQQGERAEQHETLQRRKDGRHVDVSLTVSPIRNRHGCVIGFSETARDITEQKRAQATLLHSNEELRQFTFAAAHDLQEPLRNIDLYGQMLDAQYKGNLDGEADQYLGIVIESARRMQTLIKDLLTYTQAVDVDGQSGHSVDGNEICRTALENLASALTECQATVSVAPLPTVAAQPAHMMQLFQNLISNGLKYRAKGRPPQIDISAQQGDDGWVFSVKDNGIGIAAEYHERIFGVFKRLHGREVPGTGIGLAICKRIVDHYRGRLWLESEVGQGSTFFFSFPIDNDLDLNGLSTTTHDNDRGGQPRRRVPSEKGPAQG
jgi:PAS domain S-box-containing protein